MSHPQKVVIMYPSRTGGVAEVCLSLKSGFEKSGRDVIVLNRFIESLIFSIKNIFTSNKYILISNLHFGLFGIFFKQSVFIIHGFPQRKHEGFIRYNVVVYGHKLFAMMNRKSVAVSYFTKFVSENFYYIDVHAVIHNILPFDFFTTAKMDSLHKVPDSLTFVGRVIKEKGVDKILEAASLIRNSGHKIIVNIVGSGTFIPELKVQFPHPDNIFHGYLSSEEKYRVLSQSNSFISLHPAEPFGITALEASALGVHCCLSALGGHTEFVPHEIFFPINNVDDIKEIANVITASIVPSANTLMSDTSLLNEADYLAKYAQSFINVLQ